MARYSTNKLCDKETEGMEDLLRRAAEAFYHEEDPEIRQSSLEVTLDAARGLLTKVDKRRSNFPERIPHKFVLVHSSVPHTVSFEEWIRLQQVAVRRSACVVPATPSRFNRWFYTDYTTHPHRHVKPFAYSVREDRGNVFALLVPNPKQEFYIRKHTYERYASAFSHCLCFDWIMPVNWRIDLKECEIANGPYAGKDVHQRFHNDSGVHCVNYYHEFYDYEVVSKCSGPRVIEVGWLMHLVPPYGMLSAEGYNKIE